MDSIQWSNTRNCRTNCDSKRFWKAVQIWVQKPHVVNRRLAAAVILGVVHETSRTLDSLFSELLKSPVTFQNCDKLQKFIYSHLRLESDVEGGGAKGSDDLSLLKICVRKLIPKGKIKPNEVAERNESGDTDSIIEVVILGKMCTK